MGYTNYWTVKKLTREQIPDQFFNDVEKVLDAVISEGIVLATPDGTEPFDSSHDIIKYWKSDNNIPGLCFNGFREKASESFHFIFDDNWSCCKTARDEYDLAVKCVLMLAEKYDLLYQYIDDNKVWSFDGDEKDEEYIKAKEFFNKFIAR